MCVYPHVWVFITLIVMMESWQALTAHARTHTHACRTANYMHKNVAHFYCFAVPLNITRLNYGFSYAPPKRNCCFFFFKKRMKFISKPNQPNLLIFIVKSVHVKSMYNFYKQTFWWHAEMANKKKTNVEWWYFSSDKEKSPNNSTHNW